MPSTGSGAEGELAGQPLFRCTRLPRVCCAVPTHVPAGVHRRSDRPSGCSWWWSLMKTGRSALRKRQRLEVVVETDHRFGGRGELLCFEVVLPKIGCKKEYLAKAQPKAKVLDQPQSQRPASSSTLRAPERAGWRPPFFVGVNSILPRATTYKRLRAEDGVGRLCPHSPG